MNPPSLAITGGAITLHCPQTSASGPALIENLCFLESVIYGRREQGDFGHTTRCKATQGCKVTVTRDGLRASSASLTSWFQFTAFVDFVPVCHDPSIFHTCPYVQVLWSTGMTMMVLAEVHEWGWEPISCVCVAARLPVLLH